jgi:hypothetical protein
MCLQTSDIATVGQQLEFVITKDADSTRDNIVLLSLRRILVRRCTKSNVACSGLQSRVSVSLQFSAQLRLSFLVWGD